MDFLLELVGELLDVPFEAAMESRRIKTWVKTLLFSLLGGAMAALFTVMTVSVWRDQQNMAGTTVLALITLGGRRLLFSALSADINASGSESNDWKAGSFGCGSVCQGN